MLLLGISGSLSRGSRTSRLIQEVLDEASQQTGVETELLEISQAALAFCDGRSPDAYEGETKRVIKRVITADCYVVGSPMYRGSYTGSFKNVFDLLPNNALSGKVVGLVATAGSEHHFLALEHQLRPLMSFFQAYTVPGAVYAHNAHFSGSELSADMRAACRALAQEVIRLAAVTSSGQAGPAYPVITRRPDQQISSRAATTSKA